MILRRDRGNNLVAYIETMRQKYRDVQIIQFRRMNFILTVGDLPLDSFIPRVRGFLFPID